MNKYKFYFGAGMVALGFIGLFFEPSKSVSPFLIGFGGVVAVFGINESG
jgi:hypothetical protein